jgi:hypothetical protein
VALVADSDEEQHFLDAAQGFGHKTQPDMSFLERMVPSDKMLATLNDRLPGVALLAEAYAHNTASGRYREWVRFFEAAFSREFTSLGKKLSQTLNPMLGYTRGEIEAWISKRHPFIHADGKQATTLLMERDARGIARRMEQAALDILFNKRHWGTWSSERSEVWRPTAWTTGPIHGHVVQPTEDTKIAFRIIDEFGIYPKGSVSLRPPENWFFRHLGFGENAKVGSRLKNRSLYANATASLAAGEAPSASKNFMG